jgi:sugar phosphate isomerase/epimerase
MSQNKSGVAFTVFTKPWKMPLAELGRLVAGLGFDGVELPVRPGYQVEPENIERGLPEAVKVLGQAGLKIASIAGPTDERAIAACGAAGVPIIRICVNLDPKEGYLAAEARLQREYDALVPILDRNGVTIGVQNHCDLCVAHAMALRSLIGKYDRRHFAAVWDPAHCGLNGEMPELAVDIVWDHLCMVNLKNAFWIRTTGPEAEAVVWRHYWTSGRQGLCHWPTVVAELKKRSYRGPVCLTAEYSDEASVNRLIVEDLAFARSLWAK